MSDITGVGTWWSCISENQIATQEAGYFYIYICSFMSKFYTYFTC